jgi:hypothetical protein
MRDSTRRNARAFFARTALSSKLLICPEAGKDRPDSPTRNWTVGSTAFRCRFSETRGWDEGSHPSAAATGNSIRVCDYGNAASVPFAGAHDPGTTRTSWNCQGAERKRGGNVGTSSRMDPARAPRGTDAPRRFGSDPNACGSGTTKMISRRLAARLERLEYRSLPAGEPQVLQVEYVMPDGSLRKGPTYTIPTSPNVPWRNSWPWKRTGNRYR